ncbi:tripartite tricarboxylate transporter substrate-binding protein [Pseudooceanicola sp.]|uniref:Bug family tripartite tricarboxylate transporter substrate binding protein n=1 Tax=Pseudooceanicola sp. TaxID=1914328 RepID=UPI00260A644E|nr:tripartite tricarboxylate transporter substrate-binding protein [Pseudooceanicola sp.]MDF1855920.1 tripartite tricarboxylate transporter substrate-binding protein [Pseudooceanicola sp.]
MRKLLTAAALMLGLTQGALAADYPSGTVTLVVPYSPGGNTDIFARHLATALSEKWGQAVVVENKPGGGSMVGTAYVSQAQPDGHTILLTTSAFATAPAVYKDLPFDPVTEMKPIGIVGYVAYILIVNADTGIKTLAEFVEKAKGSDMFAATAGLGTTTHFGMEKFLSDAGLDLDIVHYKGGGPAMVAVLSKEADVFDTSVPTAADQIRAGKLNALAVMDDRRVTALPDVPTTTEAGYPDVQVRQWIGLFVPSAVPDELVEFINTEVNELVLSPEFQAVVAPIDINIETSSVAEVNVRLSNEMAKWKKLAEERGISN